VQEIEQEILTKYSRQPNCLIRIFVDDACDDRRDLNYPADSDAQQNLVPNLLTQTSINVEGVNEATGNGSDGGTENLEQRVFAILSNNDRPNKAGNS
jgi:hypothetical protein